MLEDVVLKKYVISLAFFYSMIYNKINNNFI